MDSILDTIKKSLGVDTSIDAFDTEIVMHINSVFNILNQLGVGPAVAFSITDNTKIWTDFLVDVADLEAVKSYIYLKVKLLFDPPSTSFVLAAIEHQISELEWRLNVQAEGDTYVPVPTTEVP